MSQQKIEETRPILQYGICPSCGQETQFDLIGLQAWPESVAKKAGFSPVQTVWQCRTCDTTLMESSLKIDQSA